MNIWVCYNHTMSSWIMSKNIRRWDCIREVILYYLCQILLWAVETLWKHRHKVTIIFLALGLTGTPEKRVSWSNPLQCFADFIRPPSVNHRERNTARDSDNFAIDCARCFLKNIRWRRQYEQWLSYCAYLNVSDSAKFDIEIPAPFQMYFRGFAYLYSVSWNTNTLYKQ